MFESAQQDHVQRNRPQKSEHVLLDIGYRPLDLTLDPSTFLELADIIRERMNLKSSPSSRPVPCCRFVLLEVLGS